MKHTSAARRARGSSNDDSLTTYLRDISAYPLITRAAEFELAKRIRVGDADALELLVCSNLRFVVAVAKKYQMRGVSLADLINEGNLGLIRAATKFDDAKGVKFISYAVWWIRQSIFQALADQSHAVRVPLSRAGTLHRIGRHTDALRHELGREPTQRELAAELDVSEEELAEALPLTRSYLSLDAPMASSDDSTMLDYLPDDAGAASDEAAVDHGLAISVEEALGRLRPREGQVLRLYFGFDGKEPMTLEGIGLLLGVTRERARQIKEKALARLKKLDDAGALAGFCER